MVRYNFTFAAIVVASLFSVTSCLMITPMSFFGVARATTSTPSARTSALKMSEEQYIQETPAQTRERIQELVDAYPVLLFMKGTKLFPQCGFSNTASQILHSFNIEFHTVDVLADETIRQGVKEFSAWPTIPQLYVGSEFIGGSDIMIELYQSGELGELIEKVLADKVE